MLTLVCSCLLAARAGMNGAGGTVLRRDWEPCSLKEKGKPEWSHRPLHCGKPSGGAPYFVKYLLSEQTKQNTVFGGPWINLIWDWAADDNKTLLLLLFRVYWHCNSVEEK